VVRPLRWTSDLWFTGPRKETFSCLALDGLFPLTSKPSLLSQAELCRKHNLKPQLLGWKAVVLERLHTLFQEDPQAGQDQVRIAELEQLVGRQAYELEILKKASRMLAGPAPSNGRSS
jgi:hypothetical protein